MYWMKKNITLTILTKQIPLKTNRLQIAYPFSSAHRHQRIGKIKRGLLHVRVHKHGKVFESNRTGRNDSYVTTIRSLCNRIYLFAQQSAEVFSRILFIVFFYINTYYKIFACETKENQFYRTLICFYN